MYKKSSLIADIEAFHPFDTTESQHKSAILTLLNNTDECFERHNFPGHVTGSAFVISPNGQQVLMTHHKFLGRWLQFGGHADGEVDIRNVALREAQEESGIMEIEFFMTEIFDIDVHPIPANPKKNEPAHLHYDIRYLLRTKTHEFAVSEESNELKWFTLAELQDLSPANTFDRMIAKWQQRIASSPLSA